MRSVKSFHALSSAYKCISQLKHTGSKHRIMLHLGEQRAGEGVKQYVLGPNNLFIETLPSMSDCNSLLQAVTERKRD